MEVPDFISLKEALDDMEKEGCVPLGIIAYNVKSEALQISIFRSVDPREANAILAKYDLKVVYKK